MRQLLEAVDGSRHAAIADRVQRIASVVVHGDRRVVRHAVVSLNLRPCALCCSLGLVQYRLRSR